MLNIFADWVVSSARKKLVVIARLITKKRPVEKVNFFSVSSLSMTNLGIAESIPKVTMEESSIPTGNNMFQFAISFMDIPLIMIGMQISCIRE